MFVLQICRWRCHRQDTAGVFVDDIDGECRHRTMLYRRHWQGRLMSNIWDDLIVAFLHEPPDRTLSVEDRFLRTREYILAAGVKDLAVDAEKQVAGTLASASERIIFPMARSGARLAVGVENGMLTVHHPMGGSSSTLRVPPLDKEMVRDVIADIVHGIDDPRRRFLSLWRLLPDRLASKHSGYSRLPADTRIPDHTIWHHLDASAGLYAASRGQTEMALLLFNLGPVQRFIEAARTTRDLWSGSMILSWLTFQGLKPILERLGPTSLVFPSLRGIPLVDQYLRKECDLKSVAEPSAMQLKSPCLPNRFLALLPNGGDGEDAAYLARQCEDRVLDGWQRLCDRVHGYLKGEFAAFPDWDTYWHEQTSNYLEVTTAILPMGECGDDVIARLWGAESFEDAFRDDAGAIRRLATSIPNESRPAYGDADQLSVGRWQAQVDLCNRLLAARRSMRAIPSLAPKTERVPPKCTILGSFEQMGPADRELAAKFWEFAKSRNFEGDRIRERERLCAVSLVKRFAPRQFFAEILGFDKEDIRFPDTATVAASNWLAKTQDDKDSDDRVDWRRTRNWTGQCLHWPTAVAGLGIDEDPIPENVWSRIRKRREYEKPPTYYAILMADGDEMGRWLRGEKTPKLEDAIHPTMRDYFKQLPGHQKGLSARRPVSPSLHAAISEALANFSVDVVPGIIERYGGALIYSGGDDVLAMLPLDKAIEAAREIRYAFSGTADSNPNGQGFHPVGNVPRLMMGKDASVSAGLAVVHYKEDLRAALSMARTAEKAAKAAGRDRVAIAIARRSGERDIMTCRWDYLESVSGWVRAFVDGKASDRWAYRLRADVDSVKSLCTEALQSLIRAQIKRTDKATREAFSSIPDQFRAFVNQRGSSESRSDEFGDFISLCQSASFLARGRDS